jgi:hypothetical protein
VDKRSHEVIKLKNYKLTDVKVSKIEKNTTGTKIYGSTRINTVDVDVECQLAGVFDVTVGDIRKVKYLDLIGNKLIQPVKG